jgi:hypothetical protein
LRSFSSSSDSGGAGLGITNTGTPSRLAYQMHESINSGSPLKAMIPTVSGSMGFPDLARRTCLSHPGARCSISFSTIISRGVILAAWLISEEVGEMKFRFWGIRFFCKRYLAYILIVAGEWIHRKYQSPPQLLLSTLVRGPRRNANEIHFLPALLYWAKRIGIRPVGVNPSSDTGGRPGF